MQCGFIVPRDSNVAHVLLQMWISKCKRIINRNKLTSILFFILSGNMMLIIVVYVCTKFIPLLIAFQWTELNSKYIHTHINIEISPGLEQNHTQITTELHVYIDRTFGVWVRFASRCWHFYFLLHIYITVLLFIGADDAASAAAASK